MEILIERTTLFDEDMVSLPCDEEECSSYCGFVCCDESSCVSDDSGCHWF